VRLPGILENGMLAVLLSGKIRRPDQKVVLVVTGRNIDSDRFLSIISQREG